MSTHRHHTLTRILIALLLIATAITSSAIAAPPDQDAVWPTKGWIDSAPEAQGMDSARLAEMFTAVQERAINLHSVVITRGGVLVAEAYAPPETAEARQNLYSVTKSVTAMLFGMAWDDGSIESLDQPVADYFPAWAEDERTAITLEDMLTMRSGLAWPDTFMMLTLAMAASDDWVEFVLDRPSDVPPGTEFVYNSGTTHLLSAITQIATGQPAQDFGQDRLFDPLGIAPEDFVWQSDPQGVTSGAWGLLMTARDAAKIGYLMLRDGMWGGERLLSSDWIAMATTPYVEFDADRDYGYQWWVYHDGEYYAATGAFGQMLIVMPTLDLVVVMTADENGERDQLPRRLFEEFVIPAVIADEPLAENLAGVAALEAAIGAFEQ